MKALGDGAGGTPDGVASGVEKSRRYAIPDATESEMRVWQVSEWGDLSGMTLARTTVPRPRAGEVLVRMAHAGVNFMDVYTVRGAYKASKTYPMHLPLTLGMEGAGTVEAVGDEVMSLPVGAPVCFCLHWGAFAGFCSVPADKVARLPEDVPTATAAAATFQGITAHYLAHDIRPLIPGDWALVTSGAGGVARLLVQMLRLQGVRVAATASSPAKAEAAREAGAELVLDPAAGDLPDRVRDASSGGVAIAYDSSGRDTLADSMACLRRRGSLVLVGTNSGPIPTIDVARLMEAGSITFSRPRLADYIAGEGEYLRRVDAVLRMIRRDEIAAAPTGIAPFDTARDALQQLVDRSAVGKTVLAIR